MWPRRVPAEGEDSGNRPQTFKGAIMNRTHATSAASAVRSARTTKNASKTMLVRLALGTTATAAILAAAAAAPASAINQDHAGAPGVVVATPSPPPSTGAVGGQDVTP